MAGELITVDLQVEWGGLLLGPGTPYRITDPGIGGLGVPEPKTTDTDLDLDAGVWLGRDYPSARLITLPLMIAEADLAAAYLAFDTLAEAWAPTFSTGEMHMQLPGVGAVWFEGRPRGLTDDLTNLHAGIVLALASFYCGDPTMYRAAP